VSYARVGITPFEWFAARLAHRPAYALYHAALLVRLPEGRFVIEQAPVARGDPALRGRSAGRVMHHLMRHDRREGSPGAQLARIGRYAGKKRCPLVMNTAGSRLDSERPRATGCVSSASFPVNPPEPRSGESGTSCRTSRTPLPSPPLKLRVAESQPRLRYLRPTMRPLQASTSRARRTHDKTTLAGRRSGAGQAYHHRTRAPDTSEDAGGCWGVVHHPSWLSLFLGRLRLGLC
jgi:hypothetical protein